MRILIDGWLLSSPQKHRSSGLRFRRLLQQMIWDDQAHEWFVCLSGNPGHLPAEAEFDHFATVLPIDPSIIGHDLVSRDDAYQCELQDLVERHKIDLYWHPAVTEPEVPVPLGLEGVHICLSLTSNEAWADNRASEIRPPLVRETLLRRMEACKHWADSLCFETHDVRHQVIESLDLESALDAVVIEPSLQVSCPKLLPTRYPTPGPLRLLCGHEHPHEAELQRLGTCFANAQAEVGMEYESTLVVIGHYDGLIRERLFRAWKSDDRPNIALEAYATIEAMNELSSGCDALVAGPTGDVSLELLSLATSNAMPRVLPETAHLRELTEGTGLYYDEGNPASLGRALQDALTSPSTTTLQSRINNPTIEHRGWDNVAAAHVACFERCGRVRIDVCRSRLRVAYASPWAPQRTGVADYSASLTEQLANHVDLTVFTEADVSACELQDDLPVQPLEALPSLYEHFDAVIYHIGNNVEFHRAIYKQAWERPGVAVIHDTNIHGFIMGAFLGSDEEHLYFDALEEGYGIAKGECEPTSLNLFDYPMCRAIAQRSLATIVHNRWARQHLEGIEPVHVIPHGSISQSRTCDVGMMAALRKRLNVGANEFVVSTMGYVNRLKRVPVIVQAVSRLRELGYPVRLIIGGTLTDQQDWLVQQIVELQLQDAVTITGYLSDDEFEGVIQLSDAILNLRFPSMGESSGTLYKSMARGKPCIVSNYAQFAEMPDDACWKIDVDEQESDQLVTAIAQLMHAPDLRQAIATNAQRFVRQFSSYDLSARLYADVLAETVAQTKAAQSWQSVRRAA